MAIWKIHKYNVWDAILDQVVLVYYGVKNIFVFQLLYGWWGGRTISQSVRGAGCVRTCMYTQTAMQCLAVNCKVQGLVPRPNFPNFLISGRSKTLPIDQLDPSRGRQCKPTLRIHSFEILLALVMRFDLVLVY